MLQMVMQKQISHKLKRLLKDLYLIFFVKIEFVLLRKSKNIENEKNSRFSNCNYGNA